ncbi:uncharacterized protein LOC133782628 [Humulus lupulus]|uniref:uncharacterized protein LOC133782628 n=1 Tax=Humulus lupulus TaxID=3486 RepID=UPI002B411C73|nr:uncharacterized protein LOC133782628 [Humulus lupulus]
MTTALQFSINFSPCQLSTLHGDTYRKPITFRATKVCTLHHSKFKLRVYREKWSFSVEKRWEDGIFLRKKKKKKREVLVRFNEDFGLNGGGSGGGGGGGGRDDGATARILGNLALAIGLTYLSMTGQLGWLFDTIVSIGLLAVVVPIVGIGGLLWWAGRDIVQDTCPNCGNEFRIFKSTMKSDLQFCPFCTQPFSIVDNKFVRDSVKFSNQSTTFGEAFSDFTRSRKEKKYSSKAVVDVEAEIKDAD